MIVTSLYCWKMKCILNITEGRTPTPMTRCLGDAERDGLGEMRLGTNRKPIGGPPDPPVIHVYGSK